MIDLMAYFQVIMFAAVFFTPIAMLGYMTYKGYKDWDKNYGATA